MRFRRLIDKFENMKFWMPQEKEICAIHINTNIRYIVGASAKLLHLHRLRVQNFDFLNNRYGLSVPTQFLDKLPKATTKVTLQEPPISVLPAARQVGPQRNKNFLQPPLAVIFFDLFLQGWGTNPLHPS